MRNAVTDRLWALLRERDLQPGERLPPERDLATQLGVSRSSLREGMRRLGDLGIVDARQGSGTYLAALDLSDLLAMRLALEPPIARLAAQRRSSTDLDALADLLAQMAAARDRPDAFAAADVRLHATVAAASHSLPARVLLDAIADLLRHSRSATAPDADLRARTLDAVGAIVAAIRAGDGDGAEAAMRRHLAEVGGALPEPAAPSAG
jgi:GntR family transcriptional repressor for pyruvate dehydrogenase complex